MGGKIRVGVHFGQNKEDQAEVEWIKETEQIAQSDYERIRADKLDCRADRRLRRRCPRSF